jgi:L-alanine-DL-glutamate epimerase-like enolase superfamily enzyme
VTLIGEVRLRVLEVPFRVPLEAGGRRWQRRRLGIVELVDDGGRIGLGEVASEDPAGFVGSLADGLGAALADGLVGRDPADADGLAVAIDTALAPVATDDGLRGAVRSAVDAAGLDLVARAAGRSAAACLGGTPARRIRLNGLITVLDPATAAAGAEGLVGAGFDCLKLKGGREPVEALVARLGAVRLAVGPGVVLRLDVNGAWATVAEAAAALERLAHLGLEYVEQPLPAETGVAALAALRAVAAVPVAADEAVTGLAAAAALLEAGAVDALIVKPARVGGPRQARAIAAEAARFDTPVVISTLFETGIGLASAVHVAASLPGPARAHGLATAEFLESDLLRDPLAADDGWLALPDGPGLGVRLDPDAVARYAA